MIATEDKPRVWVGCLACYNDGTLRGEWLDAAEADEFTPCEGRGHEEWWVFDHENMPISGECSPMEAAKIGRALADVDGPAEAVRAFVENDPPADWDTLAEDFADAYAGEWESVEDYARELFEDTAPSREAVAMLDSWPFSCIDWAHAARELTLGGDIWTHENGYNSVYVFRNV